MRRLPAAAAVVAAEAAEMEAAAVVMGTYAVAEVAASPALAVETVGSSGLPATHFDDDHEEATEALSALAAEVLSIIQ